jgi:hypothetical protein
MSVDTQQINRVAGLDDVLEALVGHCCLSGLCSAAARLASVASVADASTRLAGAGIGLPMRAMLNRLPAPVTSG